MKFCYECGKPLNENAKFCEHCGISLLVTPSPVSPPSAYSAPTYRGKHEIPSFVEESNFNPPAQQTSAPMKEGRLVGTTPEQDSSASFHHKRLPRATAESYPPPRDFSWNPKLLLGICLPLVLLGVACVLFLENSDGENQQNTGGFSDSPSLEEHTTESITPLSQAEIQAEAFADMSLYEQCLAGMYYDVETLSRAVGVDFAEMLQQTESENPYQLEYQGVRLHFVGDTSEVNKMFLREFSFEIQEDTPFFHFTLPVDTDKVPRETEALFSNEEGNPQIIFDTALDFHPSQSAYFRNHPEGTTITFTNAYEIPRLDGLQEEVSAYVLENMDTVAEQEAYITDFFAELQSTEYYQPETMSWQEMITGYEAKMDSYYEVTKDGTGVPFVMPDLAFIYDQNVIAENYTVQNTLNEHIPLINELLFVVYDKFLAVEGPHKFTDVTSSNTYLWGLEDNAEWVETDRDILSHFPGLLPDIEIYFFLEDSFGNRIQVHMYAQILSGLNSQNEIDFAEVSSMQISVVTDMDSGAGYIYFNLITGGQGEEPVVKRYVNGNPTGPSLLFKDYTWVT